MISKLKELQVIYENKGCTVSRVLFKYINWTLKKINPMVSYKIYNHKIKMPYAHNLPNILSSYDTYSYNLKRVFGLCYDKFNDLSMVDIGANIGDTALLLNNKQCEILCIEGDEGYYNLLVENTKDFNVTCLNYLVSDSENRGLTIESKLGSGSVIRNDLETDKTISLDDILSNLEKKFLKSKFLKIDTDGFDFVVLRSAFNYLNDTKPVIFLEFDPYFLLKQKENPRELFIFLKKLNYTDMLIYDNFGYMVMSLSLNDERQIDDLILYFTGRGNEFYSDICFFNEEDKDVFDFIYNQEIEFYRDYYKQQLK
jgi:FkbM family methyltransferase